MHPALTSLLDEWYRLLAGLMAYVGGLALLAMLGVHVWDQLQSDQSWVIDAIEQSLADEPRPIMQSRPDSPPAPLDYPEKTATYEVLRQALQARKHDSTWPARPLQQAPIGCVNARSDGLTPPDRADQVAAGEFSQTGCRSALPASTSPDWLSSAGQLTLRGTL
jgi:hypothetical protein